MANEPKTFAEILAEEEMIAIAKVRAEMAAERRAWLALTDAERAAITAEREAYWRDIEEASAAADKEEEE
jgi:hypothetical protein